MNPKLHKATFEKAINAAAIGNVDKLAQIVKLGIDLGTTTRHFNRTPLMVAAGHGQAECVKFLLPYSNAMRQTPKGESALYLSIIADSNECFDFLLPYSLGVPADREGTSMPMLAAYQGNHHMLGALVQSQSFDLRARDHEGMSALMFAAQQGNIDNVQLLLPHSRLTDRTFKASGEQGKFNALDIAHLQGHQDIVQLIAAYALAQTEQSSLSRALLPISRGKRAPSL